MTRHPLDPVSLVFGLAFAGIGVTALAAPEIPLQWFDLRWALPVIAVVAGLWLLATSRRRDPSG